MIRKIILCILFFAISPLVLSLSVYFFGFHGQEKVLGDSLVPVSQINKLYVSLPEDAGVIAYTIKSERSVPVIIENYLRRYNSPLLPYSDLIVRASSLNGVDPRLIVAIAQQESNLGKSCPENCFNAWGWGIHSRGTKCFSGWEEAIQGVVKGIAEKYCSKGYCEDPCIMMKKYTPKSNGSWCFGINQFLREMERGEF